MKTSKEYTYRLLTAAGCLVLYLLVLFGGIWMMLAIYDKMFGPEAAYSVENSVWLIAAGIPTVLFLALMSREVLILLGGDRAEKKRGLDHKQMMGITAVFVVLLLAANFMAGLCFDMVGTDGVKKYVVRRGFHDSWQEVEDYQLEAKGGELRMTFIMDRGQKLCYGNGLLRISSDAFEEQFPNGTYDYLPWAAAELKKAGVKADADWDALEAALTDEAELKLLEELKEINSQKKE